MVKSLKYSLIVVQSCLYLWLTILILWGVNWKLEVVRYSSWMEVFKDIVGSALGIVDMVFIAVGIAVLFTRIGMKNKVLYWSALVLAVLLSITLNNSLTPG